MQNTLDKYNKYKWEIAAERQGGGSLFDFIEDLGFLTAPASGKFHCSYRGGLLEHSVSVVEILLGLRKMYKGITPTSCKLVGLCHDVGKLGTDGRSLYAADRQKGQFKHNDDSPPVEMGHAIRSLYLVSRFISLSSWEAQAIMGHDGQHIPENRRLAGKETPLTLLLHFADMWSAFVVETGYNIPDDVWLP